MFEDQSCSADYLQVIPVRFGGRARASCTGQSNWGIRDSDSDFNSTTKGGANWRLRRTSSTKRTSSAERRSTALPFEVLAIVRQYRFKKKFNIEEREKQGEGARTTSEECTSHQKVLVQERREVEDENIYTYRAVMAVDPNQAFKDTGRIFARFCLPSKVQGEKEFEPKRDNPPLS
ncbi:hypothetical protein B0H14DRAFT_2564577 [Mycena olivaceomarginata]|nr:hypothetical protein B0H14DRAFT_2564577 [Mycena olivaceomarginata]